MTKAQSNTKNTADIQHSVIKAALEISAQNGWLNVQLSDIAAKTAIDINDIYDHFYDRTDILATYGRMLDRRILRNVQEPDASESHRDTLFDLLMDRFEILNEDREGVCAIIRSFRYDPKQAIIGLPHLGRSMGWVLDGAGINTNGLKGALKIAGLTAIYVKTLYVWAKDDSTDMSKTMAELDKNLGRAEQWSSKLGF